MAQFKSPLTRQQYDELVRNERMLLDTLPMIDRAESCGIECQSYRDVVESLRKQIEAIKMNWFDPVPK